MNLLKTAKAAKCKCAFCNCQTKRLDGSPIFGNDINDCRLLNDGTQLCYYCAKKYISENGTANIYVVPEWIESDRITDYGDKYDIISDMEEMTNFKAYKKNHAVVRCQREDTTIFVYGHGKKRYGRRYSFESFLNEYDLKADRKPENKDTNADKWEKRVSRVIKCLEKSGLWPNLLEQFKLLATIDYEDRKKVRNIFYEEPFGSQYTSKEYDEYIKKYPFAFVLDENGKLKSFKDNFFFGYSDASYKPMYFGKYYNKSYKEQIAIAFKEKKDITLTARTSYDVTFQYSSAKNAAWYSEEYKNCGNGHYYLAIDGNTALFYEDD